MGDHSLTRKLQIQPVYASRSLWEALAAREDLGYEVLEFSVAPLLTEPDRGGLDKESAADRDSGGSGFDSCRKWYRESGRAQSVHGAFIDVNPASSDAEFLALSRRRCHESCALARSLGAGHVVFHSSCETFLRGAYLDHWAGKCAPFYEMLADIYDLHIWIENSRDTDTQPIYELMKRVSDPRIGVCLDFGHVNYSRVPMEQWFEVLGSRIGYLHLSDNNGLCDEHLPPGDGTVDWAMADTLWKQAGREMLMTVEAGGIEGVSRSIAYLKEHGYFGL